MDKGMADSAQKLDQAQRSCSRLEAITALMIDCRPGHSLSSEQLSTIGDMIRSETESLRECLAVLKDF